MRKLLLAASLFIASTCSASFSGYTYQQIITINSSKVPSTQSNFPVLISTTDIKLSTITASGGHLLNSSGFDLVFSTVSNCSFLLNWDTETYNASTGQINVWVKVSSVTAISSATVYMCYGNSSITTYQGSSPGTWDSNFKGVWHMPNGTTLSGKDSTANGINGTLTNSPTAGVGQIDGAGVFANASNRYLNVGTPAAISSLQVPMTISGWFFRTNTDNPKVIVGQYASTSGSQLVKLLRLDSDVLAYYYSQSAGDFASFTTTGTPTVNNWHYFSVTTTGSTASASATINIDNSIQTQSMGALSATPDTGVPLYIGADSALTNEGFTGRLDEIRISDVARSRAWQQVEFNNQSSPSTFYTLGAEGIDVPFNPVTKGLSTLGGCVTIRGGKMQVL